MNGLNDKMTKVWIFLFFFQKVVDIFEKARYNIFCSQEWRNWQTRTVQVRVVAIP